MKRISFLTTAILLVFISCKNQRISENEKKGVKEVVNIYGGKLKYTTLDSLTGTEQKKYFKLEISKSRFVDQYAENAELPASGMAYAFYKKLGNEKNKYTDIKSVLVFDNNKTIAYIYPVNELELVNSKIKIAEKIANLIKEKNFDGLKPLLNDSSYAEYNKDKLIESLREADAQLGKANELVIVGYRFVNVYGKNLLHISGQMNRDTRSNAISIMIDPSDTGERALMINYTI